MNTQTQYDRPNEIVSIATLTSDPPSIEFRRAMHRRRWLATEHGAQKQDVNGNDEESLGGQSKEPSPSQGAANTGPSDSRFSDHRAKIDAARAEAQARKERLREQEEAEERSRYQEAANTGGPDEAGPNPGPPDEDEVSPIWVPRTLADLKTEPLSYIVPPYLPDMGTTVLYSKGGVGKGFTALHWAQKIARTDRRIAILDWEHHPYEWDERSYQFGFTKADRLAIHYYDPFSGEDYWPSFIEAGSLRRVASDLRELFDRPNHYVDYVIVDSFFAATSGAEAMGGQRDAKDFHEALKILGRPALFLAHTADSLERFPRKPFGSVHVTSPARMTWAMEKAALDRDDTPEGYESSLVLELRNMKQSRGPEAQPQFLRFKWDKAKNIEVDAKRPSTLSISYLAQEVLGRAEEPLSAKDIATALKDTGQGVSAEVLYATMNRNFDRFTKVTDKKGRARWRLKSDDLPAERDVDEEETA